MLKEALRKIIADVALQFNFALLPELHHADPDQRLRDAAPFIDGVLVRFDMLCAVHLAEIAGIEHILALKDADCSVAT